jgi:hypothetical protein
MALGYWRKEEDDGGDGEKVEEKEVWEWRRRYSR